MCPKLRSPGLIVFATPVGKQFLGFIDLAFHHLQVAAHGVAACLLLEGLGAHSDGYSPGSFLDGPGEREHAERVSVVPGGLGLLEQHIALHGEVTDFLCPIDGAVPPVVRHRWHAEVAVEPGHEFGALRSDGE